MEIDMMAQDNLGGYIKGGDPATYFPEMWRWVIKEFNIKDVLDLGCGEGHAVKFFRELGCHAIGVDGVKQEDPDVFHHDFEQGPWSPWPVELIWTCEFVEHVEERFLPNVIPTFHMACIILMTHAFPGQQGHHHVNCRDPEYWKGFMAGIGFQFDARLTEVTKSLAKQNKDEYNHYARSGLAFKKVKRYG